MCVYVYIYIYIYIYIYSGVGINKNYIFHNFKSSFTYVYDHRYEKALRDSGYIDFELKV